MIRHELAANKQKMIKDFAKKKGTSSMRKHLAHEHINMWLLICDQRGIKIVAATVRRQVEAYCTAHGQSLPKDSDSGGTCWKYSKEGFVDTITEWITKYDQLFHLLIVGSAYTE